MALDLVDYELRTREAVMAFWGNREMARQKQIEAGVIDQGERAGVTGGKNMDGFIALVMDLVRANGLAHAQIHQTRALLTLPGYFRPTKLWDLLVMVEGRLVAAVELKSQVGPSFGNNYNNRTEEAIGTAHDLWTAYREGAFPTHDGPVCARSQLNTYKVTAGVPGSPLGGPHATDEQSPSVARQIPLHGAPRRS